MSNVIPFRNRLAAGDEAPWDRSPAPAAPSLLPGPPDSISEQHGSIQWAEGRGVALAEEYSRDPFPSAPKTYFKEACARESLLQIERIPGERAFLARLAELGESL